MKILIAIAILAATVAHAQITNFTADLNSKLEWRDALIQPGRKGFNVYLHTQLATNILAYTLVTTNESDTKVDFVLPFKSFMAGRTNFLYPITISKMMTNGLESLQTGPIFVDWNGTVPAMPIFPRVTR